MRKKKHQRTAPPTIQGSDLLHTFFVREGQWFYETIFCWRPDSIIDMVDIKDTGWLSSPMDSPNETRFMNVEPTNVHQPTSFTGHPCRWSGKLQGLSAISSVTSTLTRWERNAWGPKVYFWGRATQMALPHQKNCLSKLFRVLLMTVMSTLH